MTADAFYVKGTGKGSLVHGVGAVCQPKREAVN